MDKYIEYTILMPCLNEEKTIGICLDKAGKYMNEKKLSFELLVIDNGSTDNSSNLAIAHGAKVVREERPGYGNALRRGIEEATGKYIIMGDCDDSYDFSDMDSIILGLKNYDLVVGNRFLGGIDNGAMSFSHRYIGVPILSKIGQLKYRVRLSDFHCGMRGFDTFIARKLGLSSEGMEFATEIIAKFAKSGSSICEVPVKLHKDGRNGPSHLRSIRDGIRHLKFMLIKY